MQILAMNDLDASAVAEAVRRRIVSIEAEMIAPDTTVFGRWTLSGEINRLSAALGALDVEIDRLRETLGALEAEKAA